MFHGCFNSLEEVLRKFQGRSEKLHGCFMKVTRKIEGCFEGILRVSQGSFKGVS